MSARTPVLVGVGVATQREEDPARALEPLDLMHKAVLEAAHDAMAGAQPLLAGIGRIAVPRGRWRYRNPGGDIARKVGAPRAVSVLASVGVLQQTLILDACRAIADGEVDTALVVGGDAGYRILRATIAGIRLQDRQQDDEPGVALTPDEELRHPAELRAGVKMPVGLYAIVESAWRARHGWSVDAHREAMAKRYSRFSEIAAENPDAWNRNRVDARTVRDASARNPMLAFPYTKLHCSTWNVDQAAALLFCSSARADELGIGQQKRIHPLASTESNHMAHVAARADLGGCPGAAIAAGAALDIVGRSIDEVDLLDLYSCFPVAVETFAEALGVATRRDLTVTGSMAFAGGPFNNYVLQATARMARLLRAGRGRLGLVSCVSGILTKQAFAVWSRHGGDGFAWRDVSSDVARATATRRIVDAAAGPARIAGYTVLHERDAPPAAVAVVDVGADRAVVRTEDPVVVARFQEDEFCGAAVRVHDGHTFALAT